MTTLELARRFIGFVQAGDIDGVRSCLHSDCGTWHNYNNVTQTVDENMQLLQLMITKCKRRDYEIHRLEEIDNGYLQHHSLKITGPDDVVYAAEAIAIVTVKDAKISLIQEWIDPTPFAALLTAA